MKSKVLRAAAVVSSVSIGFFLVFRASTGCGSSDAPTKVDPDRAASSAASTAPASTTVSTSPVESGEYFPGSKAPGGPGFRLPKPQPSIADPEEFFGGSKSGPMRRKVTPTPNEPNQNDQQQQGN